VSTRTSPVLDADHAINDAVNAAYRQKYGRYAAYILDAITSSEARSTTMELVPRSGATEAA
jgi:hypothetical protein